MGDAPAERLQRVKALYSGSVSHIDKSVGRILDTLDAQGLADDTIVVFVSDHGESMGDQGMWQKGFPFEASVRVPMLVRFPGRVAAGARNEQLVSLLDLMPTFLDVAQVDYPGARPLPGASLLAREGGGLADDRDAQILELGRGRSRWLTRRSHDWKYSRWLADGWEELYDLGSDPAEDTNLLLGQPSAQNRRRADDMLAELTAWEGEHGFEESLEDGELVNLGLPPQDPSRMQTNGQFPRWVAQLSDRELAQMESPGETVLNAIAHETTFGLEETNLRAFRDAGGSLEGTDHQRLLDELD
jgi:arylsulfatase A-like enzyme